MKDSLYCVHYFVRGQLEPCGILGTAVFSPATFLVHFFGYMGHLGKRLNASEVGTHFLNTRGPHRCRGFIRHHPRLLFFAGTTFSTGIIGSPYPTTSFTDGFSSLNLRLSAYGSPAQVTSNFDVDPCHSHELGDLCGSLDSYLASKNSGTTRTTFAT